MGTRELNLIGQKMANLTSYLRELEPLVKGRFPSDKWSAMQQRAIERLVQIIIESLVDINALLILDAQTPPAASAREGFEAVHALGVIGDRLRERFGQDYVKLRNRIVHAYDKLEPRAVYYKAQRLAKETQQYQQAVSRYLRAQRVSTPKGRRAKDTL